MAIWLLKTEPSAYSWADLVKAKQGVWDGVSNPTAVKHMRSVKQRDLAVLYHTGDEKAAVGVAEVTSDGREDPKNPKLAVFDLAPRKALAVPVTLAQLKAEPLFADSPLLKMGRLSVVPLDAKQWKRLLELAKTKL